MVLVLILASSCAENLHVCLLINMTKESDQSSSWTWGLAPCLFLSVEPLGRLVGVFSPILPFPGVPGRVTQDSWEVVALHLRLEGLSGGRGRALNPGHCRGCSLAGNGLDTEVPVVVLLILSWVVESCSLGKLP